jgi:hypothetical protein
MKILSMVQVDYGLGFSGFLCIKNLTRSAFSSIKTQVEVALLVRVEEFQLGKMFKNLAVGI